MLDETSLTRLFEMGIDVYVPRAPTSVQDEGVAQASTRIPIAPAGRSPRVALLARAGDARARALLAEVSRALAYARIECTTPADADEAALADARGVVVLGEALAREIGAALSAERQRTLAWVAGTDASAIAADARAKRALWSELKRLVRECRRAAPGSLDGDRARS